jgi:shikimate dehydrogenase
LAVNRLAVLGHPVSHSRSPAMQTAALEALGLAGEWAYEAIDVEPAAFDERTRALPGEGFAGVNVTIPHKEAALALADEASRAAREIGAANTLSFAGGRIEAENTDATGLVAALPVSVGGKTSLVLGAGGSARAAAWALAGEGASVSVWNRTGSRADELAGDLGGEVTAVSGDQARAGAYEVIVNCTAIGMHDEDPFEHLPIDPERFRPDILLVDLVYAGSESGLVATARSHGALTVDGLEVLVRQGAESLRIWTGMDPPLDVMREAASR